MAKFICWIFVKFKQFYPILSLYILLLTDDVSLAISKYPKVIMLSVDGFRYDYLTKATTPNFHRLIEEGVTAKWITVMFPTKTFPNHQSMATGLYVESHGMVANVFYDPVMDANFSMEHTSDSDPLSPQFWNAGKIIPLWHLNERAAADRYSGAMMWPGSGVPLDDQHIRFHHHFQESSNDTVNVDNIMLWLTDDLRPANLIYLYFPNVDVIAHLHGPDSQEVKAEIELADSSVGHLINRLEQEGVYDDVNIVITSDHGMSKVIGYIDIRDVIANSKMNMSLNSPLMLIWPFEGYMNKTYKDFRNAAKEKGHFQVMWKENIPKQYHYMNNYRISPIILLADDGYNFVTEEYDFKMKGNHGYNNTVRNMHPFFIARGPDFKRGYMGVPFENVDIFPLLLHILQLPDHPSNGSLNNVLDLLVADRIAANDYTRVVFIGSAILLVGLIMIGAISFCYVYNNQSWRQKNELANFSIDGSPNSGKKSTRPAERSRNQDGGTNVQSAVQFNANSKRLATEDNVNGDENVHLLFGEEL